MVSTLSVSGEEAELASLLKNRMTELGYNTFIDQVGNVVGLIGEGSPHVLLCGHMDTVPGDLPITLENGVLTGRGSVDAKGPLASLIIGGLQALDDGFIGSLTVVGAVDEEGQNKGVNELIRKDLMVDYAVFGEPSNVNTITVGYKGAFSARIKVSTEPGHSSAPWMYVNVIEAGMELYNSIKEAATSMTVEDEGFKALTVTIRQIHGGGRYGTMPGECEMWIGFRIPIGIKTETIIELVRDQVLEFESRDERTKTDLLVYDRVEPYLADNKSKLVKSFSRSIYIQTHKLVTLVKKSGTGDMNYFGNATGTPCITYGPGDSHLDHTDNEHIIIEDYLEAIKVISQALLTLKKLHMQPYTQETRFQANSITRGGARE
jgi:LysW-gamma-L-lysine carboxypeptidase